MVPISFFQTVTEVFCCPCQSLTSSYPEISYQIRQRRVCIPHSFKEKRFFALLVLQKRKQKYPKKSPYADISSSKADKDKEWRCDSAFVSPKASSSGWRIDILFFVSYMDEWVFYAKIPSFFLYPSLWLFPFSRFWLLELERPVVESPHLIWESLFFVRKQGLKLRAKTKRKSIQSGMYHFVVAIRHRWSRKIGSLPLSERFSEQSRRTKEGRIRKCVFSGYGFHIV